MRRFGAGNKAKPGMASDAALPARPGRIARNHGVPRVVPFGALDVVCWRVVALCADAGAEVNREPDLERTRDVNTPWPVAILALDVGDVFQSIRHCIPV